MNNGLVVFAHLALLSISATAAAEGPEWPQWRGPDRTDISQETGLLQSWPEGGPKQVWLNRDVGLGYSGFSIVDGRLFTMGARLLEEKLEIEENPVNVEAEDGGARKSSDEVDSAVERKEYLIAIDVATGEEMWSTVLGDVFVNRWGDGPRGTPTVDGDYVYALSAQGDLVCVQVADGEEVWRTSLTDNLGGPIPKWGYTESVLIDGQQLLCTPGGKQGAIAALDKRSGEVVWRSTDFTDGAQYASIIVAEHAGVRQYIQLTMKHLVGIQADDGARLWSSDWPGSVAVVPTPIYHDGYVYISSGYGVGCKLVQLDDKNQATEVYANRNMKNHHGGVILLEDHLYGYSDNIGWVCQDFATGDIAWKERDAFGKGAIAYADDRFYCLDESDGSVVLIGASTAGWQEHGRFVLEPQTELRKPAGRIWTHPVIVDGKLFLRDQELLHCYNVRGE